MLLTRRALLKALGVGAGGLATGSCTFLDVDSRVFGGSPERLVFIFLGGGLDGIHAVQPKGDPGYAPLRAALDIEPATLCLEPVERFAFLHPRLNDLAALWDAGDLAIVHRVGLKLTKEEKGSLYSNQCSTCADIDYPCHHVARRAIENGDPHSSACDGWLYRYAREAGFLACEAGTMLAVQPGKPLVTHGAMPGFPIELIHPRGALSLQCEGPEYSLARDLPNLCHESTPSRNDGSDYCCIGKQDCPSVEHDDALADVFRWNAEAWNPRFLGRAQPGPEGSLEGTLLFPYDLAKVEAGVFPDLFYWNLKMCALALLENERTRIVATELGSMAAFAFDWHRRSQYPGGSEYRNQYEAFARGLRALKAALSGATHLRTHYRAIWRDTAVVALSEFGRSSSVADGTNHGDATCAFIAGGAVRKGLHNCDPTSWEAGPGYASCLRKGFGVRGLDDCLSVRTDYRALLAEVLTDHMGARSSMLKTIFPNFTPGPPLGLFA